ncbi:hypothetical protein [Salegentibacter maritimus]|uniref:Uncharacterized protein n=1 Tax=Salegentibacter maritimus TaxID=2794347 RepID=A0ABS0TIQ4_9FLAO|nr:hypothetical protein [Salegentibacter maritimus]MBI6119868.1 hypothetical protein [Salegentibacter maritimus]
MKDYGMLLEKTIEEYWGHPKTPIYFANYYGDKFEMKALLFALVIFEINYKPDEYKESELIKLRNFERTLSKKEINHKDRIEILEFLAKRKNLINEQE